MRLITLSLVLWSTFSFGFDLQSAKNMSCLREVYDFLTPTHPWELSHREQSAYWVLLRKDKTGFLIAQPIPSCNDQGNSICPFWLRTVEFKENWVGRLPLVAVPCPKMLTEEFFRNLIRHSQYKGALTLN